MICLVVTSNYAQGASYSGRKSMLMKCVQVAECKQTNARDIPQQRTDTGLE